MPLAAENLVRFSQSHNVRFGGLHFHAMRRLLPVPPPQSRGCFACMKPWLSGGPPTVCHRCGGMDPIYPAGSRMDPPYPALTSLNQAAPKTEGQIPSSGCQAGAPPFSLVHLSPCHAPCAVPCPQPGPAPGGEDKTKQSWPGSKYYLDIKERYVSLYGSRISAF